MAQPILMSAKLDKHSAIQPTKSTCSPTRAARDYKMTDAYTRTQRDAAWVVVGERN